MAFCHIKKKRVVIILANAILNCNYNIKKILTKYNNNLLEKMNISEDISKFKIKKNKINIFLDYEYNYINYFINENIYIIHSIEQLEQFLSFLSNKKVINYFFRRKKKKKM